MADEELQWRARIEKVSGHGDEVTVLGCGFLVSPTQVLTCAHVVEEIVSAEDMASLEVVFPDAGIRLRGTVSRPTEWTPHTPGDIAVVLLNEPTALTPCTFATREELYEGELELTALGFPRTAPMYADLLTRATRSLDGEWWQVDVEQAHLPALQEGFSGSAAYLRNSNRVVGMITDSLPSHGGFIGLMLPWTTIRKHWEELDEVVELSWLDKTSRRELRLLLSEASSDISPDAVFKTAFPGVLNPPHFRSLWHAVREISESPGADDRLYLFLRALAPRLDLRGQQGLRTWMRTWLREEHHLGHVEAMSGSAVVRVQRLASGQLDVTMNSVCFGLEGQPRRFDTPVPADGLRNLVENTIGELAPELSGVDFKVVFIVPSDLLSEDYDEWSLQEPGADRPRPMRDFPVIVRHLDRLDPTHIVHRLAKDKWRQLRHEGKLELEGIPCTLPFDEMSFRDWLAAQDELCALTYSAPPRQARLHAALDLGIPIMIWRRHQCAEPCAGNDELFFDDLHQELAGVHPDALPGSVKKLRRKAQFNGPGHCGSRLTLFWDDPSGDYDPPLASGA